MSEIKEYLQLHFNIKETEVSQVAALFETQSIKRGNKILITGKACRSISFVKSGILRISALSNDKDVTQWIVTKGYFAADLNSFMFAQPSRWDIETLTDSLLYSISKSDYDKLPLIVPEWNLLERQFLVHCFTTMENRIFEFLSMSAEQRYFYFFKTNKDLFNQVPLQYIASILGMTPETFSRIRRKFIS